MRADKDEEGIIGGTAEAVMSVNYNNSHVGQPFYLDVWYEVCNGNT